MCIQQTLLPALFTVTYANSLVSCLERSAFWEHEATKVAYNRKKNDTTIVVGTKQKIEKILNYSPKILNYSPTRHFA